MIILHFSSFYGIRTRGAFGGKNTITAAEVFLDVKALKSGKAAGCDEIRPEMLKTWNRGVLWLTRVSGGLLFLEGTERLANLYDHLHTHERETGVNAPTTGASLCLASLEKYMPSALKKMPRNN